jgi:hypothetical protein
MMHYVGTAFQSFMLAIENATPGTPNLGLAHYYAASSLFYLAFAEHPNTIELANQFILAARCENNNDILYQVKRLYEIGSKCHRQEYQQPEMFYLLPNFEKEIENELKQDLQLLIPVLEAGITISDFKMSEESCTQCGKSGQDTTLQRCTSCKVTVYCGRQCQLEHWKKHKTHCKGMGKLREWVNALEK